MDDDSKTGSHQGLQRDRGIADNDPDRRQQPRVAPSAQEPVILRIEGQDHHLLDISIGGVSFHSALAFEAGQRPAAELRLPGADVWLEVPLLVLRLSPPHKVSSSFEQLSPEAQTAVQEYVLSRQERLLDDVAGGDPEGDSLLP